MGPQNHIQALTLVLAAILAGCADPAPAPAFQPVGDGEILPGTTSGVPANATSLTTLEADLGAVLLDQEPTMENWFVLGTTGTPEGGLAGFSWSLPEGAAVPDGFAPDFTVTVLEVAPIIRPADLPNLREWMLLAFVLEDDTAEAWSYVARGTWHWTELNVQGLAVTPTAYDEEPDFWDNPVYFYLDYGGLKPGAKLGFVLGARTSEPAEFALAFRVMDHDPPGLPPGNFAAFRSNLSADPPKALPRLGTGQGLHHAAYYDVSSLGIYHYEGWTPDVRIQRNVPNPTRPAASVQDVVLGFEAPFARGFSYGFAGYYPFTGAGQMAYDFDLHGTASSATLLAPPTAVILVPGGLELAGIPYYYVAAEGDGPARAELHATGANGPYVDLAFFEHIELGATTSDLLNTPLLPQFFTQPGLLSGPLPVDAPASVRILDRPSALAVVAPNGAVHNLPRA